jgi:hypothetical protein
LDPPLPKGLTAKVRGSYPEEGRKFYSRNSYPEEYFVVETVGVVFSS